SGACGGRCSRGGGGPAGLAHEALALEVLEHATGVRVGSGDEGVERDLGVLRRFVGIVDAREALDLTTSCLRILAFAVPPLALLEGRVHEHLDEVVRA